MADQALPRKCPGREMSEVLLADSTSHTSEILNTRTERDQSAEAPPIGLTLSERIETLRNKNRAELERRSSSQESLRENRLWKNESK